MNTSKRLLILWVLSLVAMAQTRTMDQKPEKGGIFSGWMKLSEGSEKKGFFGWGGFPRSTETSSTSDNTQTPDTITSENLKTPEELLDNVKDTVNNLTNENPTTENPIDSTKRQQVIDAVKHVFSSIAQLPANHPYVSLGVIAVGYIGTTLYILKKDGKYEQAKTFLAKSIKEEPVKTAAAAVFLTGSAIGVVYGLEKFILPNDANLNAFGTMVLKTVKENKATAIVLASAPFIIRALGLDDAILNSKKGKAALAIGTGAFVGAKFVAENYEMPNYEMPEWAAQYIPSLSDIASAVKNNPKIVGGVGTAAVLGSALWYFNPLKSTAKEDKNPGTENPEFKQKNKDNPVPPTKREKIDPYNNNLIIKKETPEPTPQKPAEETAQEENKASQKEKPSSWMGTTIPNMPRIPGFGGKTQEVKEKEQKPTSVVVPSANNDKKTKINPYDTTTSPKKQSTSVPSDSTKRTAKINPYTK